jgi:hypothetical protein
LAIFRNGDIQFADRVKFKNRIFVPIPRTSNLLRHVQLPRGTKSYGTVESLVAETGKLLFQVLDLSSDDIDVLTLFILSTRFVERVAVAPYLAFVGLPSSGKSTALSVLKLLCRRALLTADISSAAFYRVCDELTPTLLIDEAATSGKSRELFHLLRAGSTRGVTALRLDESFNAFGPKAVAWINLPNDAALNSRCIVIPLREIRQNGLLRTSDMENQKAAADCRWIFWKVRNGSALSASPFRPLVFADLARCAITSGRLLSKISNRRLPAALSAAVQKFARSLAGVNIFVS